MPNPFQAHARRPTMPVLSDDGRYVVDDLPPMIMNPNKAMCCTIQSHDSRQLGTANQLNLRSTLGVACPFLL